MKKILISTLLLIFSVHLIGQKIKYKDIKDDYSINNYSQKINQPKYSTAVAGICTYILPGLGHIYIGEPLRGAYFFGGELLAAGVFVSGLTMFMTVDKSTGKSSYGARTVLITGILLSSITYFYSLYDVIKITKIKNLAYQEKNISMNLSPNLRFMPFDNNFKSATYELTLRINF